MSRLLLFLNELSCSFEGVSPQNRKRHILETILAIRESKKIRNDLDLITHEAFNRITFGPPNDQCLLNSIIGGDDYKEEWRFLKSIAQSSTLEGCPEHFHPLKTETALFNGKDGIGLGRTIKSDSLLVSFGFSPWDTSQVSIQWHFQNSTGSMATKNIEVPNISKSDHPSFWRAKLENAGLDFSSLSVIYSDSEFSARMYAYDHNPPHIHIFENISSTSCIALFNIDLLEFLECNKSAPRKAIISWAQRSQTMLMENWKRRYKGGKIQIS